MLPHDLPDVVAAHEANGAELMIGSNYDEGTSFYPRRRLRAWRRSYDDASAPRAMPSPSSTTGPIVRPPPSRKTAY